MAGSSGSRWFTRERSPPPFLVQTAKPWPAPAQGKRERGYGTLPRAKLPARSRTRVGAQAAHQATVREVAFSSDSRTFLTRADDGSAHVWEVVRNPATARRFTPAGSGGPTALSRDGKVTAISTGKEVRLFDTA